VLRSWLGVLFTGVLCALTLPFFAVSFLIAGVCTLPAAVCAPFRKRKRPRNSVVEQNWQANEFAFERAIEAYEELIDAHTARQP